MTERRSADDLTDLSELESDDVLPMEIDDGTRITCSSIAGGKCSTDGVPDFLHLSITKDGISQRVRYVSDRYVPRAATPPRETRADEGLKAKIQRVLEASIRYAVDGGNPGPDVVSPDLIAPMAAYLQVMAVIDGVDGIRRSVTAIEPEFARRAKKPAAKVKKVKRKAATGKKVPR